MKGIDEHYANLTSQHDKNIQKNKLNNAKG